MRVYVAETHTSRMGTRFEGVYSTLEKAESALGFSDWRTVGEDTPRGYKYWEGHGKTYHYTVYEVGMDQVVAWREGK